MKIVKLEKLIWVLIYGGLLLLCLGLFVRRAGAGFGLLMMVAGTAVALAGAVLVAVRARIAEFKDR